MIRSIVRDPILLSIPSTPAGKEDLPALRDLADTLKANADRCVGMAGNMIGVRKRILAWRAGPVTAVMLNPVILSRSGPYETEEGCLSLDGLRRTTRYETIEVEFLDGDLHRRRQTFRGFAAQILQHEMDHFEGKLI